MLVSFLNMQVGDESALENFRHKGKKPPADLNPIFSFSFIYRRMRR
jgi:hypothetical protein